MYWMICTDEAFYTSDRTVAAQYIRAGVAVLYGPTGRRVYFG